MPEKETLLLRTMPLTAEPVIRCKRDGVHTERGDKRRTGRQKQTPDTICKTEQEA